MSNFSRRSLLLNIAVALPVVVFASSSFAANTEDKFAAPFTQAAFDKAQVAGKSVLLVVHASWCPTCKAQEPILENLLQKPENKGIVAFRVDYDAQKDVCAQFSVRTQSTLIGYKGKSEVKRSVGDTNAESVATLVTALR